MRDFIDRHHKICESRGGMTVPENIVRLNRKFHSAFHQIMENKTPVGQIEFVRDFNSSILSDAIKRDINKIIMKYSGANEIYAYKEGTFDPDRLIESQFIYKK